MSEPYYQDGAALSKAADALRSFEPSEYEGLPTLQAEWREKGARAVLATIDPGDGAA